MRRMQAYMSDDDFEILTAYCDSERISVSALLSTLVVDFLETTDKKHVAYITNEAKKIKSGRPKEGDY